MTRILVLLFCLITHPGFGQDAGLRMAQLGNFSLANGQTIQDCRVGYRTFGKLNAGRTNAVLFPTWFGGISKDLTGFVGGAASLVDSTRFYVVLVDALGNGVSSSPSNSITQRDSLFPEIGIPDMVKAEYRLLTESLGVKHVYAVLGISMGGMQTFQWMVSYPDFVERAIPIVGSPKQSAMDLYLWGAELQTIETAHGSPEAMRTVSLIHAMNLRTPAWHARQTSVADVDAFLTRTEQDITSNPFNWATQLRAMIHQDIFQSVGKTEDQVIASLKPKVLIITALQDHMVTPFTSIAFARKASLPLVELTGDCGHLATSCEAKKVQEAVAGFLK